MRVWGFPRWMSLAGSVPTLPPVAFTLLVSKSLISGADVSSTLLVFMHVSVLMFTTMLVLGPWGSPL